MNVRTQHKITKNLSQSLSQTGFLSVALSLLIMSASSTAADARRHPGVVNTNLDKLVGDEVITVKDIQYTDQATPGDKLDMHVPIGYYNRHEKKPLPVVVYIHGGGFIEGDKSSLDPKPLLNAGFAVCSVNYRLAPAGKYPASVQDVKAAVRWVRAHTKDYFVDGNRIGAWGTSAGGYYALMLGTTCGVKELNGELGNNGLSSCVKAVCACSAPSDLETATDQRKALDAKGPMIGTDTQIESSLATGKMTSTEASIAKLLGSDPETNKAAAKKASPITYVSSTTAPTLLIHGEKDAIVPTAQSRELSAKLLKAGVKQEFITYADCGHSMLHYDDMVRKMINFFQKNL